MAWYGFKTGRVASLFTRVWKANYALQPQSGR